jgi:prepilin-type processing-associated H-X9-DG protein
MDPTHEITFNTACLGINATINGLGSSGHPGGCNTAIADGSVTFISETIDLNALKAALTKAGGENASLP